MSKAIEASGRFLEHHVVTHSHSIAVADVIKRHLDNAAVIACKRCKNYDTVWTCPPFDFEREDYWNRYTALNFQCDQVFIDANPSLENYSSEEIDELKMNLTTTAKDEMVSRLLEEEAANPTSKALFPGTCWKCEGACQRKAGKPCINPNFLRPSIEALGGNNVTLIREIFGLEFQWALPGEIPDYYILTGGLLVS